MDTKLPRHSGKKGTLHPRNPHSQSYDFEQLCTALPELEIYVHLSKSGRKSIDFSNPDAVKALNQALLKAFYQVRYWDIPQGYLCPPIPGRADYIHYIADLLSSSNGGSVPVGKKITGLDIGTGANCIYPILGSQSYGWRFIGSDVDPVSIASAEQIVKANPVLKGALNCRQQNNAKHVFNGIIRPEERFDFTLCNPPFHSSQQEANKGSRRKVRNLSRAKNVNEPEKLSLNFAGQGAELWCEGGERAFVRMMIMESQNFADQCLWFTCLVSKKENLAPIYKTLKQVRAKKVKTIEMSQGQKVSRFVAWTFHNEAERLQWVQQYWNRP